MDSVMMSSYDRLSDVKAFDDTKAGVKGLVDAGVTKVPRIFIDERVKVKLDDEESRYNGGDSEDYSTIPVVDLGGINEDTVRRSEVIAKIRDACEKWGFFQVINHEVPVSVMNGMIDGVRKFHEQDTEVKKQFYNRSSPTFQFNANYDLYQTPVASWRDSIGCVVAPKPPALEELPVVCREIMLEYSNYIMRLGHTLFELLSEVLGLNPNHLNDMGCANILFIHGHYYPECPEPELTFGTVNHTDAGYITVLLQDQIGGLQVLHENRWVDVPFLPGALVINIADLLQLCSNDKLKSVYHRVLARNVGPRISVSCFFTEDRTPKLLGPIKELLSEENPPVYREVTSQEFFELLLKKGIVDGICHLSPFKLHN